MEMLRIKVEKRAMTNIDRIEKDRNFGDGLNSVAAPYKYLLWKTASP
jgi:hypothetical protein